MHFLVDTTICNYIHYDCYKEIYVWSTFFYGYYSYISNLQCDANRFARLTTTTISKKKSLNDLTLAISFCALEPLVGSQI